MTPMKETTAVRSPSIIPNGQKLEQRAALNCASPHIPAPAQNPARRVKSLYCNTHCLFGRAMAEQPDLQDLETPALVVDLDRMEANLDRAATYASKHSLSLRPHIKTHKSPLLAEQQLNRGAVGVTCATPTAPRL